MFLKMTSTITRKNAQDLGQHRRKRASLDLPLRKSRVITKSAKISNPNLTSFFWSSPSLFVDLFFYCKYSLMISPTIQGYWKGHKVLFHLTISTQIKLTSSSNQDCTDVFYIYEEWITIAFLLMKTDQNLVFCV